MEQNKPGYMRNLVELKVNFELFLPLLGFAAFSQIVQLHTVINSASPESARKRTWSRSALDFQKNKKNQTFQSLPILEIQPRADWDGDSHSQQKYPKLGERISMGLFQKLFSRAFPKVIGSSWQHREDFLFFWCFSFLGRILISVKNSKKFTEM